MYRDDSNESYPVITNEEPVRLTIEIISDNSGFDAIAREWNELTDIAECHVFQTHTWLRTWWKYFGGDDIRHQLHIMLFRYENRLVGIAPFFIDEFQFMGKSLYRCLRLIGSSVLQRSNHETMDERTYSDFLDLIMIPGYDLHIWPFLADHIMNSTEYSDIVLDEIPDNSPVITGLIPYLKESNQGREIHVRDVSVCAVVKFPESWEQFLKSFSKKRRYNIRMLMKRTSGDTSRGIFDCRKVDGESDFNDKFAWLVSHHQQRWNSRGRPGVFADKLVYEFYREATYLLLKEGIAKFQVVSLPNEKGRIIVTDLFFRFKKDIYGIQRSFDATTQYNKYSPGHTSLFALYKYAIDEGIKNFNFLRGDEEYKFHSANQVIHNKYIIIKNVSATNRFSRIIYKCIVPFIRVKQRYRLERDILTIHCKENGKFIGIAGYSRDIVKRLFKSRVTDNLSLLILDLIIIEIIFPIDILYEM